MLTATYKLTTLNMLTASKFTRQTAKSVAWQSQQAIHFQQLGSFEATATSWWAAARTVFLNPVAENFWYAFSGIARRKRQAKLRTISGAFTVHAPFPQTAWGMASFIHLPFTHLVRATSWVNVAAEFRVTSYGERTGYLSLADHKVFPTFAGLRFNEESRFGDSTQGKNVTLHEGGLQVYLPNTQQVTVLTKCNIFRIYGLPAYVPAFGQLI